MIDLHTHSLLSDGELLPSELIRRAEVKGYDIIGITDHVDPSNMDFVINRLLTVCARLNENGKILVLPGIELTHIPPELIPSMVVEARGMGAKLILNHGETLAEPVKKGVNRAAIEAGVDILTHPGLITEEDALMASKKGVYLEITTRDGHSITNGHVVNVSRKVGASIILNTDAHSPSDLVSDEEARKVAFGAGLGIGEVNILFENSQRLADKIREV
ncbi:MAG: histidinol phosphate phosphatase domain-containing protein [Thermodesulfobacteriota bacterium]